MNKIIEKIAPAKFKVFTNGVSGSELELNFNPIIQEFGLHGDFSMIHWQARPKGHRQWGIYTSSDDTYRSIDEVTINCSVKSLQLDDTTAKTIPSAVLFTAQSQVTCINQKTIIGNVFLSDVA